MQFFHIAQKLIQVLFVVKEHFTDFLMSNAIFL